MREITVLGAGCAGLSFVRRIREKNRDVKITLIDKSPYYYDKTEFTSSLSLDKRVDLQIFSHEFNIPFLQAAVERINCNRRKIYLKATEPVDFDILVTACGLLSRKVATKGEHREGFFYLSDFDPFKLKELLKISNEATVQVSTLVGLKLALALRGLNKEVTLVAPNLDFLGDQRDSVLNFLQKKGITIYLNSQIDEAIGEGAVKAVKISPVEPPQTQVRGSLPEAECEAERSLPVRGSPQGETICDASTLSPKPREFLLRGLKVFAAQLVFIDSGFMQGHDFFEEPLNIKDAFFSEHEGIYFIGDTNNESVASDSFYLYNQSEAQEQGILFADFILGGEAPLFQRKVISDEDRKKAIDELLRVESNSHGA